SGEASVWTLCLGGAQLKDAVVSLVGEDFINNMRTGLEHRDAEKTHRDYSSRNQPIDELSSWIENLMCDYIDDDDDDLKENSRKSKAKNHKAEIPDISYTVRTRHKTKARNGNHPSKKYARGRFEALMD
ncbi:hypothetical protein M9458_031834, partial [Cirrhinus mrigala]